MLLGREHRLHRRADGGAGVVGSSLRRGQVEAGLAAEVDIRAQAVAGEMGLVGGGPVGGIGLHVAGGAGLVDDRQQPSAVVGRRVGDGEAPHEAVRPVDRDVVLVPEHRDGDLDLRLGAVVPGLASLRRFSVHGASRSFWASLAGFAAQSSGIRPSFSAAFSASVFLWRGAAMIEASTIWPDMAR